MGREEVKEKERVNMWRQKDIYIGPYIPKGWEVTEAREEIRPS